MENNKGKGLYEQMKNNEKLGIKYPLTKERFLEAIKHIFKNYKNPTEFITPAQVQQFDKLMKEEIKPKQY